MRILMILDQEFPPDLRVENEIGSLILKGHTIHLACISRTNKAPFEEKGNLIIHRRYLPNLIYKSSVAVLKLPFYFKFWRNFIDDILRNYDFDAVHIHDLPLAGIGIENRKKNNLRVTLDFHENWPAYLRNAEHTNTFFGKFLSSDRQWRKYELSMCNHADSVIVVVDEAKERLVSAGISGEKIHIVSNTLNLDSFSETGRNPEPGKFVLFYAGGIDIQRGLQTVIRSISILNPQNFEFWILGKGKYLKELKRMVSTMGLEDKVIFKGHVPYKEVPVYMSQTDAAVIPHLRNDHTDSTVAHKLFQYMYVQLPILSSDCKPLKRIIDETNTGVIFRSDDAVDCARGLKTLIDKTYSSDGKGKEWILNKYNWGIDSKELLRIYNQ